MSEVNDNFAYEYLNERNDYIESRKTELLTKCNQNQIQIDELKEKIVEIKENYDETYELFSPKPRTSEFSKTEMAVLAARQSELLADNRNYLKEIEDLKDEQEKIEACFNLIRNGEKISKADYDINCATNVYMEQKGNVDYLLDAVIGEIDETSNDLKKVVKNHITLKNVESRLVQAKKNIYASAGAVTGLKDSDKLENKLETIIGKLNHDYDNKISFTYEGEIDRASDFSKDMIYKISKNILNQIVSDVKGKVTFKLAGKEKHVNIVFEIPIDEELTKDTLLNYYIDRKESTITVRDLILFSNGEEAEFDDASKKQFIIRIS